MRITEHFERAKGETLFSFEIIPPQKGQSIQKLYDNIDPLMEFKPPFIDVTTSREEHVYIQKEGGLLERKVTRMRPGTVGICASLMNKYKVDTVPHVLCGGFTREETEYVLVDCHYLGIDNVMALRGDAMKHESYFPTESEGNKYASDLVKQISDLNQRASTCMRLTETNSQGQFLHRGGRLPRKALRGPELGIDLRLLKEKIDAWVPNT